MTHANYNGMTVNLRRDFQQYARLGTSFFTLGYTWSHEMDNVSGFRAAQQQRAVLQHDQFRASGDTDVRNALRFCRAVGSCLSTTSGKAGRRRSPPAGASIPS